MAALSAPAQGVWASKWRGIFILLTHTHTHILTNAVNGVCSHSWRPGAPQGELGLASWHAVLAVLKFLIAFRGLWCSLHPPAPSPHHPPGLPLAGNCILSAAIADKWGRRGAAHCHQPTWPVSHCNLQCVSRVRSYPAPTAGLGERACMFTYTQTHMCGQKYTHRHIHRTIDRTAVAIISYISW